MFLLWCFSMTQVLHLSSLWNKFLVSLLISIQSIDFPLVAEFHLIVEMFSISPLQAYLFIVGVPTTPFDHSPKDAFSSSFEVEDVVFSSVVLIPFLHLFRRHCDVALFDPSSYFVKIMFNSFHLQSECCPNYIILIPSLSCLTGVLCLSFLF